MQNTPSLKPLNIDASKEEVSMADTIRLLCDGKRWIAASTIVCSLLGGIYVFFAQPKYEATADIQMATIGGTPIEPTTVLGEKLKLPLYYSAATHKACKVEDKLPAPGQVLANQLKPISSKNSPFVTISFRAASAAEAKQCLDSVISDIRQNQEALSKPVLDVKKSQLHLLQQKLEGAEKLTSLLPIKHLSADFNDSKNTVPALLLATSITKDNEIKDLRNQINEMQIVLSSPFTRETSLVTPIYAPDVIVAPKSTLIILGSVLGGMLLGILILMGRKFSQQNGLTN